MRKGSYSVVVPVSRRLVSSRVQCAVTSTTRTAVEINLSRKCNDYLTSRVVSVPQVVGQKNTLGGFHEEDDLSDSSPPTKRLWNCTGAGRRSTPEHPFARMVVLP